MDESPQHIKMTIEGYDFGHLMHRLASRCVERQTIMRFVLRSIEDGSIVSRATSKFDQQGEIVWPRLQMSPPAPELMSLRQAVIDDTFVGVVRALFDYVDGLHGGLAWFKQPFVAYGFFDSEEALQAFLIEKLDAAILGVAFNQSLSTNKKIKDLGLGEREQRICDNLREVRNALEHHKGFAQKDLILTLARLEAVYLNGQRMRGSILNVAPGDYDFHFSWIVETYPFVKGERIALDESHVEQTIGTILNHLMPLLRQALYNLTDSLRSQMTKDTD